MGSKNILRGIMKAIASGMKASEVWQEFKSKLGLIQEIFTGISFQEKQFGRPEMNNNNKMKKEEGQKLCNLEELKRESTKGGVREAPWKRDKDKDLSNLVQMHSLENRKCKP